MSNYDPAKLGQGVGTAPTDAELTRYAKKLYELPRVLGAVAVGDWNRLQPPTDRTTTVPPSLIRLGEIEGYTYKDQPLAAMFPGLGAGNIAIEVKDPNRPQTPLQTAQGAALRWLAGAKPGTVEMYVYDSAQTGAFAAFQALGPRLFHNLTPKNIEGTLSRLADVQHDVATVDGLKVGTTDQPLSIVVIIGDDLNNQARDSLIRLTTGDRKSASVLCVGTDLPNSSRLAKPVGEFDDYRPDRPVSQQTIARVVRGIAQAAEAERLAPLSMEEFIGPPLMKASAAHGIEVAIGRRERHPEDGPARSGDGLEVLFRLDEECPHGIIQGPSGKGKSNVLRMIVAGLAAKYGPDELGLYLMDGAGTTFSVFGPNDKSEVCLPQACIVGSSIEPEAGLAVLQHLVDEARLRTRLMTQHNADNLADLRANDPQRRAWPRLVLFYDEIHTLLKSRVGDEAVELLDVLAREARKAGIHIVPITQTLEGISTLWGNGNAIEDQLVSRIGTPLADIMNSTDNRAITQDLDPHRVVVNDRGGNRQGNRVAHVPYAPAAETRRITERIWKANKNAAPPLVLDAQHVPNLETTSSYQRLRPTAGGPASGFVGVGFMLKKNDKGSLEFGAAEFKFDHSPGRNLAVIGSRGPDIVRVFRSTAKSIAKQSRPGSTQFSIICCDGRLTDEALKLRQELTRDKHSAQVYSTEQAAEAALNAIAAGKEARSDDRDHYVLVYGGANDLSADESAFAGTLKRVIDYGPSYGVHTVVSCARIHDLKSLLGGYSANMNAIGGYVGLDLTAADAQALTGQYVDGRQWRTAPNRALFLDKRVEAGGVETMMLFQ